MTTAQVLGGVHFTLVVAGLMFAAAVWLLWEVSRAGDDPGE